MSTYHEPFSEAEAEREKRDPYFAERQASNAIKAVLADLDRQWQVPPVAFCGELAREVVRAIQNEPGILSGLVAPLAAEIARAVRGRLLLDELARLGITIRLEGGQMRAGPPAKVTDDVLAKLKANKADLLAAMAG